MQVRTAREVTAEPCRFRTRRSEATAARTCPGTGEVFWGRRFRNRFLGSDQGTAPSEIAVRDFEGETDSGEGASASAAVPASS